MGLVNDEKKIIDEEFNADGYNTGLQSESIAYPQHYSLTG